jgi:zinc protease
MRSQEVPDEELYRAKALLLRKLVLQESSEEAVARGLLARAELDLPLDEPLVAAKKYRDLTAAEVKSAFARLIRNADLVQVVRGPQPH